MGALAFLSPTILKAGAIGLAFLSLIGGSLWFVHHERNIGAQRFEAAVKAATDAEQKRQSDINQNWKQWADGAVANADQQKAKMNDLEKQVADASASLKGRACLPVAVTDKLRAIDLPGGQTHPASPARGAHR
jgi:hypothetical protein